MRVQTQNDNLLGALGAPTPIEGSAKAGSSDFPNHFRAATGQETPTVKAQATKVQAEFGKQTVAQQLLSPSETLLQTKTTPAQPLFKISTKEAIITANALPETAITVVDKNMPIGPITDPLLDELDTAMVGLSPLAEQEGLPETAQNIDVAKTTNPELVRVATPQTTLLASAAPTTLIEPLPQSDTAETSDGLTDAVITAPMPAPTTDSTEPLSLVNEPDTLNQKSLLVEPSLEPLQAEPVPNAIPLVQNTAPSVTASTTPRPTTLNGPAAGIKADNVTKQGGPIKVPQVAPTAIAQPTNAPTATIASPIAELVEATLNTSVNTAAQNDQTVSVTETANAFQTVKNTEINPSQTASPELTVSTLAPTATASVSSIAPTTASGSAAQMAPPPPLDMSQNNWAETLVSSIERPEGAGDADTLTLNLTPERLGNMQVRLEQRDGLTHVHIVTSSPEAAKIVNEAQHRLADLMTRAGLEMGNQSTSSDLPQNTQQNGNGWGQETAQDPNAPMVEQGEFGNSDTLSEMTPPNTATQPTHAVDLLA